MFPARSPPPTTTISPHSYKYVCWLFLLTVAICVCVTLGPLERNCRREAHMFAPTCTESSCICVVMSLVCVSCHMSCYGHVLVQAASYCGCLGNQTVLVVNGLQL